MFIENLTIEVYEKKPAGFDSKIKVAGCYLEIEKKILFLQRSKNKTFAGTWEVPGGKFENNETPKECARRELFEETGIQVKEDSLHHFGTLFVRKPEVEFVFYQFEVGLNKLPNIILSQEHQDYLWVSPNEITSLNLIIGEDIALKYFYDRSLLKKS